ncbi:tetratricopeptide repeat protein [Limisalsivibrio acetivorans]|uniref:tetratricopeptide repeat protein n=1 Tax=Limisalsivibrio acetivorans TaxID=1304888 RepID=UPI0003B41A50|nr:hypothetical protein [Limisalsivibrio acetivorans]
MSLIIDSLRKLKKGGKDSKEVHPSMMNLIGKKKRRKNGLVIALAVMLVTGAGGYFAAMYYTSSYQQTGTDPDTIRRMAEIQRQRAAEQRENSAANSTAMVQTKAAPESNPAETNPSPPPKDENSYVPTEVGQMRLENMDNLPLDANAIIERRKQDIQQKAANATKDEIEEEARAEEDALSRNDEHTDTGEPATEAQAEDPADNKTEKDRKIAEKLRQRAEDPASRANSFVYMANAALSAGDTAKGVKYYREAFRLNRSGDILNNLFIALAEDGRYREAGMLFTKNADLLTEDITSTAATALAGHGGDYSGESLIHFAKKNGIKDTGKLSYTMGYIKEQRGDTEKAAVHYAAAYELNPGDEYNAYAAARMADINEDYQKALDLYRGCASMNGELAETAANRISVLHAYMERNE